MGVNIDVEGTNIGNTLGWLSNLGYGLNIEGGIMVISYTLAGIATASTMFIDTFKEELWNLYNKLLKKFREVHFKAKFLGHIKGNIIHSVINKDKVPTADDINGYINSFYLTYSTKYIKLFNLPQTLFKYNTAQQAIKTFKVEIDELIKESKALKGVIR